MYVHISNKVSGLIKNIFNNSKRLFSTIRQLYTFGVESFTDGWIREQCNLTSRFPNVFVQGLNLAKNRPTSLIWTEYSRSLIAFYILTSPKVTSLTVGWNYTCILFYSSSPLIWYATWLCLRKICWPPPPWAPPAPQSTTPGAWLRQQNETSV